MIEVNNLLEKIIDLSNCWIDERMNNSKMQLAEDRLCSSCKAHGLEIKKAHGPCSYLYSISSRCLSSSLSASLHNCNVCSRVMLRHPNSSHQCLTGAAATVRLTSYHSLHGRPRHLVRDRPLAKVAGPEGSPKVVTFGNHKGSFCLL